MTEGLPLASPPDAQTVLEQLHTWFIDHNRVHLQGALQYRSFDEFRDDHTSLKRSPVLWGQLQFHNGYNSKH